MKGKYIHGKKVVIRNPEQSQKLGIAMVFQELTLVGEMTVWENIYLNQEPVTRLGRINRKEIKKRILDVMDRYGSILTRMPLWAVCRWRNSRWRKS